MNGAVQPDTIARSIAKHSGKTSIGAHDIFLGQVRADVIDDRTVEAIEYSAYTAMAEEAIAAIREEAFARWPAITCLHVHHSIGVIPVGELCFMVFASAPHRGEAFEAVRYVVDAIKARAPIFGKEIFAEGGHVWKKNT
ncbi:MAG TPA: molybdenum cofactor biosynthesis protein MoaE [Flavobacteriales bacterium]|nr:molybdenum cofactor biosynthesis protein MoaE [Flavobacteriales bacterium]